ncbi:3-methyl-2-oxobutanoate hydroxymethyltransferase, partial [Acetobacter estunensis]|uniref:3-methyl-2-oxobutanoate hydroxymethyltransferase n=1 Tax=Acetobacter estunensis TaxID=104097 RepID=UPI001C2D9CFE|nr:3-methyl-2-oxobutanoate hydroxymethyltransferase [Acetobacter estunensis]
MNQMFIIGVTIESCEADGNRDFRRPHQGLVENFAADVLGHDTTLPVTLDDMIHHASAVMRASRQALVIADLPFLSYAT